jgi:hypothetical protein
VRRREVVDDALDRARPHRIEGDRGEPILPHPDPALGLAAGRDDQPPPPARRARALGRLAQQDTHDLLPDEARSTEDELELRSLAAHADDSTLRGAAGQRV